MLTKFAVFLLFFGFATQALSQSDDGAASEPTYRLMSCADGEHTCENGEKISYPKCGTFNLWKGFCDLCEGRETPQASCEKRKDELSNWMKAYDNRSLRQITLPASHDSAMSNVKDFDMAGSCSVGANYANTRTQKFDIATQLRAGVRMFDVRPIYNHLSGEIYSHHGDTKGDMGDTKGDMMLGCMGHSFDHVLTSIRDFVRDHPSEVVILDLSHFKQAKWSSTSNRAGAADTDIQRKFSDAVYNKLRDVMITPDSLKLKKLNIASIDGVKTFLNLPLKELLSFGNVLVLHDGDSSAGVFDQSRGFFTKGNNFHDDYSNTNSLNVLALGGKNNEDKDVQSQALSVHYKTYETEKFVTLAWTLTQSTSQAVGCGVSSYACSIAGDDIESLAARANDYFSTKLMDWYMAYKNPPNAVSLDFIDGALARQVISLNNLR